MMIKGVDLSSLSNIEDLGGKFFYEGKQEDCLKIMKKCDINLIRIRLFNNPFSEDNESYGAGYSDIDSVIKFASRVEKEKIDWLLDFHYSDFWADPGKQILPKSWKNYNLEELIKAVYDFTYESLNKIKANNLKPSIIAIGNEITNGMLWPYGHVDNFENLVKLINSGIKAAKKIFPDSKIMIHLDNVGRNDLYTHFFDSYFGLGGLDFDYIGLSYYILWHDEMDKLKANMDDLAIRYKKDMIIAETSYPFSDVDYKEYEKLSDDKRKGPAAKGELLLNKPFAISEQGQAEYIECLMKLIDEVKDNRGKGFIYWGGEDIPVPGFTWASDKAIEYTHEKGPGGNEWANQALFDYDGHALQILDTIKKY